MLFSLFRQNRPIPLTPEGEDPKKNPKEALHELNIEWIGSIEAESAESAIVAAKRLDEFRLSRGLARFPILEEITEVGTLA